MVANKLKKGDEVRIIAPARSMALLNDDCIEIATKRLTDLGLKVTFGKYVYETDSDYSHGSIEHRAFDLNEAFSDLNVKCILTVMGGYNSNQLLKYIDFENIKNNPKIFCGFSDITALSNAIYAKTGLVTYSGPHFSTFGMLKGNEFTIDHFIKMFFEDEEVNIVSSDTWSNDSWYLDQENREFIKNDGMFIINKGTAEGTIIGGNLCTVNLLQGTKYMPSIKNSILFIEDDGLTGDDFLMNFDRDFQSLIALDDFKYVKGIVIGRAEKNCNMNNEKWIKMIKNKVELDNMPVIAGADFGHTTPIITFPIGGYAQIDAIDEIKLVIK